MKNVEFVVGLDYSGKYTSARRFIDSNEINEIVVFDFNSILERYYYKNQIIASFDKWKNTLSRVEVISIFVNEINNRLKNTDYIDNYIIIGDLTFEEIIFIKNKFNIENFKVLLINPSTEILFRNYTLSGNKNVDYERFEKEHLAKSNEFLLGYPADFVLVHQRDSVSDDLPSKIGSFFGYKENYTKQEPYIWPIVPKYKVLNHDMYGSRLKHMILGKERFHSGFDITAETMTEIKSSSNGVVVYSGLDERILSGQSKWNQRYGNVVEIVDDYGRRQVYAHLRKIFVKEGNKINQGEVIAYSGCSGGARIPHLHFEIRKANIEHSGKNNTIDPLIILPQMSLSELNQEFVEEPYCEIWKALSENPWGLTDSDIPYADSKKLIR